MTKVIETQETIGISRIMAALTHRVVWYTALATFISTMITVIIVFAIHPEMTSSLWGMPIIALAFGFIAGMYNRHVGYRHSEQTLTEYASILDKVAAGDLLIRLILPDLDGTREAEMLRHLGQTTNRTLDTMQGILQDVSEALKELETGSEQILVSTALQIQMGSEQDAVVTETTATVNEVRATVTETAERAQSVAETAQLSVDISRTGTNAVEETIEGMEAIRRRVEDIADNILELSEHTQQIGEIIAAVNHLADQSRMLALNASVEAARAGEEGKGFAVVAMEVRNLADQNRDATIQIREILGEIQRATNSAVMVTEEGSKGVDAGQIKVNKAGDSIRELSKSIEEAAMAAMQIAASTRQQTIGMDQLTDAMRTIKHSTAETVSSTMQVEKSVNLLREAAQRLNKVLDGLNYAD